MPASRAGCVYFNLHSILFPYGESQAQSRFADIHISGIHLNHAGRRCRCIDVFLCPIQAACDEILFARFKVAFVRLEDKPVGVACHNNHIQIYQPEHRDYKKQDKTLSICSVCFHLPASQGEPVKAR
jgi:hypothetical protein